MTLERHDLSRRLMLARRPRKLPDVLSVKDLKLQAIRREGEDVGFWQFLNVGAVMLPLPLIAAQAVRMVMG